jgi:hypothetical protein
VASRREIPIVTQTLDDSTTSLQFDRAEYASEPGGIVCATCQQEIAQTYYEANGKTLCERCRYAVADHMSSTPGASGFFKAVVAGGGAAIAGATIYGLVLLATDRIFGLIAILVGYMVGRAVQWATGNRGGWRYQTLAIVLTYVAIVSAYAPILFKGIAEADRQRSSQSAAATPGAPAATAPDTAGSSGRPTPAPLEQSAKAPGLGAVVVALGMIGAILLASPFLGGFDPLGWAIIAFGLYEAWKLNRRVSFEISGPFTAGTAHTS